MKQPKAATTTQEPCLGPTENRADTCKDGRCRSNGRRRKTFPERGRGTWRTRTRRTRRKKKNKKNKKKNKKNKKNKIMMVNEKNKNN
jgi:hypothetical protein